MSRQYLSPGFDFVDEDGTKAYLLADGDEVNETSALAPAPAAIRIKGYAPMILIGSMRQYLIPGLEYLNELRTISYLIPGLAATNDTSRLMGLTLSPPRGSLTITTYAPSPTRFLSPGPSHISITGRAPSLNTSTILAVGPASLHLTPQLPGTWMGVPVPPSWPVMSFANGTVKTPYDQIFTPDGIIPLTVSLLTGSLPPGLALVPIVGATYRITGTPTLAGTWNFTLRATNSLGSADSVYSITVFPSAGGSFAYAG